MYSIEEIEKIVEKELRNGKTIGEISKQIGKCRDYVSKIKKHLIEKGVFTEEEIVQVQNEKSKKSFLEDSVTKQILKYVRAGLPQDDIARLVNRAQGVVSHKISLLRQYGIITQQEIDNARSEYIKEVKSDNFRRDLVLENLRNGRLKVDFAEEIGLTERGVSFIQMELIEDGVITQEEIDEAVRKYGKEAQKENKVIELLKQGYTYEQISANTGYGTVTVRRIKEKAINEGKITEEEYQKARKKYQDRLKTQSQSPKFDEEQEVLVLEMLKKGKPTKHITRKTGLTVKTVKLIIKSLVAKAEITEEYINKARESTEQEIERKILIGLKKGYTQQQIADSLEEYEISQTGIGGKTKKLIERGIITQEEIEQCRNGVKQEKKKQTEDKKSQEREEKRQAKRKRKKESKSLDKKIIKLLLEGYKINEIAEQFGYVPNTIAKKLTILRKKGKINEEELEQAREKRKEEDKQNKDEKREENKKKEQDEKIQQEKKKMREEEDEKRKERAYKEKLERAKKIPHSNTEMSDEKINKLVNELIHLSLPRQQKGGVSNEDVNILQEALFEAHKLDADNVLGIAKLYLKNRNYQSSIYILNYSKNFLDQEEDILKIDKAVEMVTSYRRKMQAERMLSQGYSIEIVQERTHMSTSDLLEMKKRKTQNVNSNDVIDLQIDK